MKKVYCFFFVLLPLLATAQTRSAQSIIDSVLERLPYAKEDTSKVRLLDLLSYNYSGINADEGLKYGYEAKALAEKLEWKKGMALASASLGINYAAKSQHTKALYYDQTALEIYEELGDKNGMAAIMANISLVYMSQSNYPKALEFAFQALKLKGHIAKRTEAIILENVGSIYLEQKNYSKTMEYYTSALKVYEQLGSKRGMARNLGNTGIVLDAKGDYNKALEYHLKALSVNREIGDENSIQINMANVGYVYSHLHNFSKALEYQMQALKISEKLGLKASVAVNLGNIGETYFVIAKEKVRSTIGDSHISKLSKVNLQRSIEYLEKAVKLCKEINYAGPQVEFTKYLSDAYHLSGDHEKALETYKEYTAVKESVFSEQNKITLSQLETQRELDLKDRDIIIKNKELEIGRLDAANKRNERVIYISGIILILVVTGIIIKKFIDRHRRHKNVLADIAQIQAHDIRGPVATIQGLVQLFNHKDPADPLNKELINYISTASTELDEKVKSVVNKTSA